MNPKTVLKSHRNLTYVMFLKHTRVFMIIEYIIVIITMYTHIFHISDIHIPTHIESKRLDEYKYILDATCASIKEQISKRSIKKSLIVIAGDILDTKLSITPDTLLYATQFLTDLSKITRVAIIIGNHDCNEKNPKSINILDAISRIDNVDYLKMSGVYDYDNVSLVVSSLIDEKFIRHQNLNIITGHKYYAVYHGTLSGCDSYGLVSSNGDSSRFRTVADFSGYDAVILGDIHKSQTMDGGRIAYSGSLLQINRGEDPHGHGYRLWTLAKNTSEHITVFNPWCFVNLIYGDDLDVLDQFMDRTTLRIQIRLKHPVIHSDIDKYKQEIRKRFDDSITVKLSVQKSISYNAHTSDAIDAYRRRENKFMLTDTISDTDVIRSIISPNKSSIIDDVIDLFSKSTVINVHSEHNEIGLVYLEWKNIGIYHNDHINTINFKTGLSSICSKNATGKSTVLGIILTGLFGKVSSNININSTSGFIKIIFKVNDILYTVMRTVKKTKNRIMWKSIVYKDEINISLETNTKNNKLLTDVIGTYDMFCSNNIIDAKYSKSIMSMSDSQKSTHIMNVCSMDTYESMRKKLMKDKLKLVTQQSELVGKLSVYRKMVSKMEPTLMTDEQITDAITKLDMTKTEMDNIQNEISKKLTTIRSGFVSNKHKRMCMNGVDDHDRFESIDYFDGNHQTITTNLIKRYIAIYNDPNTVFEDISKDELDSMYRKIVDIQREMNSIPRTTRDNHDIIKCKYCTSNKGLIDVPPTMIKPIKPKIKKPTLVKHNKISCDICKKMMKYDPSVVYDRIRAPKTLENPKHQVHECVYCKNKKNKCDTVNDKPVMSKYVREHNIIQCKYCTGDDTTVDEDENMYIEDDLGHDEKTCGVCSGILKFESITIEPIKPVSVIVDTDHPKTCLICNNSDYYNYNVSDMAVYFKDDETNPMYNLMTSDVYNRMLFGFDNLDKLVEYQSNTNKNDDDDISTDEHDKYVEDSTCIENYKAKIDTYNKEMDLYKHGVFIRNKSKIETIRHVKYVKFMNRMGMYYHTMYVQYNTAMDALSEISINNIKHKHQKYINSVQAQKEYIDTLASYYDQVDVYDLYRSDQAMCVEHNNHINSVLSETLQKDIDSVDKRYTTCMAIKTVSCIIIGVRTKNEINDLRKQYDSVSHGYIDDRDNIMQMKRDARVNSENVKMISELVPKLADIDKTLSVYIELIRILEKKNLPYIQTQNHLKQFDHYVNVIFQKYTNYVYSSVINTKTGAMSMMIDNRSINSLSGYESLALNISILYAMSMFSDKNKHDIIIIDESIDCIDTENFDNRVVSISEILKETFSVIIMISHRDIPRSVIDNEIEIRVNNGLSTLNC